MKFAQFCQWLAHHAGKPSTFLVAVALIIMWAATGPWFHYNDTWQLIVNTSTTIITNPTLYSLPKGRCRFSTI